MTIKFTAHIVFDLFIYFCFWTVFKNGPYAAYAENVVLFWFWIQATIGILWFFVSDPKVIHDVRKQVGRSKIYTAYGYTTMILEILVLAALGYHILAFFYLLGAGNMANETREASKQ